MVCKSYGLKAVFLPLQDIDKKICGEISSKMNTNTITVTRRLAPGEIMELVSKSCMCVGMRLHMLIYAAAVAVPLVGIVYDPKVSGFMEYAGQTLCVDADKITKENLFELAKACLSDRERIKGELTAVRDELSKLAGENSDLAVKLYNRN
jgi:polysaccharide pyruvyl transferase WcaK-like protein